MKKLFLSAFAMMICFCAVAQNVTKIPSKSKFIFIIRFKADFVPPSKAAIDTNVKHWNTYMGNLAKTGKLITGYRPGSSGQTISGTSKTVKAGFYIANDELVSSFLIINAVSLDEASSLAKQCPVLEFGGSVEVRPLDETAE